MTPTTENIFAQHSEIKKKHTDAIVLLLVGDFYETFQDDARDLSEILGITLTKRDIPGQSEPVIMTGFPHAALDSYLPKIVDAGRRTAICNIPINPIPEPEPKPEPAPKPVKDTIKRINCTQDLREKGEPIAYLHIDMPACVRDLGKFAYFGHERPCIKGICIEPENEKLLVTDCHLLQVVNIICKGDWPDGSTRIVNGKEIYHPFQFNIDPRAIAHMAGKRVDIAVWADEDGNLDVTGCEALGLLTQYDERIRKGQSFPDYTRVIPEKYESDCCIAEKDLTPLRKFIKENLGTKKGFKKVDLATTFNTVRFNFCPSLSTVQVSVYTPLDENEQSTLIAQQTFSLSQVPPTDMEIAFFAPHLYAAIDFDFNGLIRFKSSTTSIFYGQWRATALANAQINPKNQNN